MRKKIKVIFLSIIIVLGFLFCSLSLGADLSSISKLRSGHNVGKTIYVKTGGPSDDTGGADTLEMCDERDHIYCIQHYANSDDATMVVNQFMEIKGDYAKAYWMENGKEKNDYKYSKYNIALAYLLSEENYRKGYSMNSSNRVRQRAIHHLWNHEWKSEVNKDNKLIYSKWFDGWSTDSTEAKDFYNRAKEKADNASSYVVPNISVKNTVVSNSSKDFEVTGPYYITYNGSISWVCPKDIDGKWMGGYYDKNDTWHYDDTIKYYKDAKCTTAYKMTEIPSGGAFYIKNTTKKVIKEIQLQNTSGVISYVQTDFKTIENPDDVIGPLCISYKGRIDWISPIAEGGGWLGGYYDNNGKWHYDNSIEYYTDKKCTKKVSMTSIESDKNFYIKNNSGKEISKIHIKLKHNIVISANIWFLERDDDKDAQRLITATTKKEICNSIVIIKVKPRVGDLTINKKDSLTNNNITSPAEFKIKTSKGKWLKGTKGSYNYNNSDYASATVYKTDNKGVLKLEDLLFDTYQIYEITAPNGYKISKQTGYNNTNNYVDCGSIKLDGNKEKNISNDLIMSIAGYVWTEGKPDKPTDESYDSLYYSGIDHKVSNVTVKLMRKDSDNKNPPTTITDENGYYIFENEIKKKEIDKYYIEFDYREGRFSYTSKGETITETIKDSKGHIKYIPVEFKNEQNGSKALADMIPMQDVSITGEVYTYKETDTEKLNIYGLSKVGTMDEENLELKNINLGIKEIPEPKFVVAENLADVNIRINGYNYKYIYGGRGVKTRTGFAEDTPEGPKVSWQSSRMKHKYFKPIYPSDVIYDKNSTKKELDVNVTYRIDITNTTAYNVKELYVEDKLILESVINNYDTKRYTLVKDEIWTTKDNTEGTAIMNENYLKQLPTTETCPECHGTGEEDQKRCNECQGKGFVRKTVTTYITFNVNRNAVIEMLAHPDGITEDYPSKVSVTGYHAYTRDDYMWNNLKENTKELKQKKNHQTESKTEDAEAPYLVFSIKPNGIIERTVSGKVFKDNVTVERGNSGEVVGDGIYQNDEKGIEGVKVELLDSNMNVTKLYQLYTENNVDKTRIIDAIVTTNQNGEYSLNGVVPGKYFLRFTYGNGTYKIKDLENNEMDIPFETKIGETKIAAKDYKSTIMNSEIVNIIKNKEQEGLWYKENAFTAKKYSLALDDTEKRKNLNEAEANKELNESQKIKEMNADTSRVFENKEDSIISVTIENTKENEAEEKAEKTEINSPGNPTEILLNNKTQNVKYEFGGFYFGLIEMPKQELKIEKIIKNLIIKNGQANVFYNGNPEEIDKQGAGVVTVTDLDNAKNGGSTYTRAEMVEASISGSDFRIAYEIKITNVSDVNYYNEEYYKFGIIDKTKEVTVTPTKVYDYLDEVLKYEPEPLNPEKFTEKYKSDKDRIEEVEETDPNKKDKIIVNEDEAKVKTYKLKGGPDKDEWITLYTDKIKNRDNNQPTSDAVIIVASKNLSMSEYDWVVFNAAEIIDAKLSTSPLDTVNSDSEKARLLKIAAKEIHANGMVKAKFTLTIPTGEDRYSTTLYAIAGIIALVVLSTGIVIIKKKII